MARKENSLVTMRANSQLRTIDYKIPRSSKSILWYLLMKFLFRGVGMGESLYKWDGLLKKYVEDPANGIPQTPEGRTSARGNLTSQTFSEDEGMSMSTFIKASAVAEAAAINFIVIWEMKDGKRIVGKHRHILTPDMLMKLSEENEETELIEEVNEFLHETKNTENRKIFKRLLRRLKTYASRKKDAENKND